MSNTITFQISIPPSVNDIYDIRRNIHSAKPTLEIKDEWKLWRQAECKKVPKFKVAENSLVRVDRTYFYPFHYKNGNWRVFDSFNLDAMLFNLIKVKIDHDDLFFKEGTLKSRDEQERRAVVTLTEIPESEWKEWA